ncbi:lycopene cyclase domain-containing protein [Leifsonia sp. fls2-241-R2A-40a]|uniref:lycopene cyclase domain-containing protein n=1 Tax=Leifsonia sp. fls2-241-R2A-40a TaxID=3040290 RepID=UPI00254A282D|nr:lycopene cyclase domain-containing protein [Leifsonia sp. fls2-241-R2A-40a]
MTYALLSVVFLAIAALVLAVALATAPDRSRLLRRWWAPVLIAGVVVLVLTAVFDNLMIGVGFMTYDSARISGVRLGLVPLEDFAYPLAGLLLLPALWMLTRRRGRRL